MSTAHRLRVLFDEDIIAKRNETLAREIAAAKPENLLVVAILKGSFMFAADLIRALHRVGLSPQVEFVHLSSYLDGTVSTGNVTILRDIESRARARRAARGRHSRIGPHRHRRQGPAHGARRQEREDGRAAGKARQARVQIHPDYVGFTCPDVFVIGYGMDVAHSYRQLPYVGVLDHHDKDPDLFDEPEQGNRADQPLSRQIVPLSRVA